MKTSVIFAIALFGNTAALSAQTSTVPVRTLSIPEAELPEPFTRISGIRELSDGRVVVVDPGEKAVVVVDFVRGTVTKIGREGSGPGEFRTPNKVLMALGDTTIVGDQLGRLSKILPNGDFAGDVRLPVAGQNDGARAMNSLAKIASDDQGRFYRQASQHGARRGRGSDASDSVAIQRIDPRTAKVDTVAWLPVPPIVVQAVRNGGSISPGGRREGPFVARATWVVAPDGRIAIVSPEPYQIAWFSTSAQRTVGQPIAFQRVPVTGAEKQAYRENYPSSPNMSVAISIGRGGVEDVSSQPMKYREPEYWPTQKDPFGNAPHTVLASPTGDVWILRQLPHTEKNPTYDVIGARGEVTGRVIIPVRSRVVGFGRNGAVYLIHLDADELQYIQRFRLR